MAGHGEREPADGPRADAPPNTDEDRLSSFVAVIIALTTLVGAVVGYLQADTSNVSSDRRLAAEQLSLRALGSAERSQQQAQIEFEAFVSSIEQRTAASNAFLRYLQEKGSLPTTESERLRLEHERWEKLAESTLRLSDIDPEGEFGPANDPTFPARYFASAAYESFRLNALQDAGNEEASRLDARAASYTAILAMLAVSLYLFGLTLAERARWLRRGFLAVGLVLAVVAASWMALTTVEPVPPANEEAAAAHARGRVAGLTAYDSGGYAEAEAHLTRAIELRPTYAAAYVYRAGAIVSAATPQRTGFASIIPDEALRRARADLQQARRLGLETASVYGSLGFYAFLEGVQTGDASLLDESVQLSRRGMELDPGNPILPFNAAVALVAAERYEEAQAAYREGVADALYTDAAREQKRNDSWTEQLWLGGALTDLAIVERHRPELGDNIRRFKELIVGLISRASLDAPTGSPVNFSDLTLEIRPEALQWWGTLVDYDSQRDVISTQWYHQDPASEIWAVLPEVSGGAAPEEHADSHTVYRQYVVAVVPARCLPPGRYKAEIYANGRLAGTGEFEAEFRPHQAVMARDITLGFCRPTEWEQLTEPRPGLLDGYRSADGQHGVYGMRYALPRSLAQQGDDAIADVLHRAVQSFPELLPGAPTYLEEAGTTTEFFLGLDQTAWRWYDTGSGWLRAGAGLTRDGAVVVCIVFGPYEWFDGTEPFTILNSFVSLE